MGIQLKNNAVGYLATAISASDVGVVLQSGNGASFPSLAATDYFYATLESTGGTMEVVKATARSGDSLTLVRAQEGTTAQSFAAGSRFELRVTAQSVTDFLQAGAGAVVRNFRDKLREAVSVKDFGAAGDGVTDDTAAIQAALDAAEDKILLVNKPSVKYISGALTVPSNIKIVMEPGAIIETNATLLTGTLKLLNITGSNVHIVGYGATIQMVKAGFSSQFNHGVSITGTAGAQIVIQGLSSNDSGGDGFYVDAANAEVTLYDCKANNNRRQGMSIIQCKSLTDYRGQYTNTTGTAPSAGIDIEPDQTGYSLGPIRLVDTICSGNDGPGIEIFLEDWATPTNYADIQIIGLKTSGNGQASINGRFRPGIDINRMPSTSPCKGRIVIQDAFMEDEGASGITVYDWDVNGPVVDIVRPTVINPNQNNANNANANGGIICVNTGAYTANSGNIFIRDPIVRDDDGFLNSNSLNPYRFTGVVSVAMENPTYAYAGSNPWSAEIASTPTINSQVEITANFTTNLTMTDWRYVGRTVTIGDAVAIRTCVLPLAQAGIVLRVVSTSSAQDIRIDPNVADQIVPIGSAAGKYITATGRGSAVTLRCRTAGFWDIEDVSGTWTSEP